MEDLKRSYHEALGVMDQYKKDAQYIKDKEAYLFDSSGGGWMIDEWEVWVVYEHTVLDRKNPIWTKVKIKYEGKIRDGKIDIKITEYDNKLKIKSFIELKQRIEKLAKKYRDKE